MSNEHPELSGYEPFENKPRRSKRRMTVLRIIVLVAVVALVLPGLFTTITVGTNNAERACAYRAATIEPGTASDARFELFGPGGLGWECYAIDRVGDEHHIDSMGLIPAAPGAPGAPTQNV